MKTPHNIFKNTFSLLFSASITQLFGFIAVVYLARVLGPKDFGKINFASAFIVYFSIITSFGLPILGTRLIASNIQKTSDYVGNILILRICLTIFGLIFLLAVTCLLNQPLEMKYLIILYGLGLIPQALFLDWAFQGVERMEFIGLGNILKSGLYLLFIYLFVKSSQQLLSIPFFNVMGSIVATVLLFYIFMKEFCKPNFKYDMTQWKRLMRQAFSMGFALIVTQIFFNIDIVMLGFLKSDKDVGYYTAAYKIILFLTMMRTAYAQAIYPAASRYYKTSLNLWRNLLELSTKLMATLTIPIAIGGTILAKPIMRLLYGIAYDNGIFAFQILIWNAALICMNVSYVRGLLSCEREDKYAYVVTVAAIINIITNFILIPLWGLVGAAVATVVTQTIIFIGVYKELGKIIKIRFAKYLYQPVIASAIMSFYLIWGVLKMDLSLFSLIFGGAIIYITSFLLLGGATSDEISSIRRLLLED